ncbi:uncharacterized protein BDV17DRAFT_175825 [Aspergillus undulatus]|uniref:uncharacterized protein n=1 Tax=Aspergillus undulatus TaxID=1810928 RepID=UPI003CCC9B11
MFLLTVFQLVSFQYLQPATSQGLRSKESRVGLRVRASEWGCRRRCRLNPALNLVVLTMKLDEKLAEKKIADS